MAIMEITLSPKAASSASGSIGDYLVEPMKHIEASGLPFAVHAMGTNIEGPVDQLLALAQQLHAITLGQDGVDRVVTSIKIDDYPSRGHTLTSKVDALAKRVQASNG